MIEVRAETGRAIEMISIGSVDLADAQRVDASAQMTDEPLDLDKHRGMAAQKATDLRRALAEVESNAKTCAIGRPSSKASSLGAGHVLAGSGRQGTLRPESLCRGIVPRGQPSSRSRSRQYWKTLRASPARVERSDRRFEGATQVTLTRGRFIGYELTRWSCSSRCWMAKGKSLAPSRPPRWTIWKAWRDPGQRGSSAAAR